MDFSQKETRLEVVNTMKEVEREERNFFQNMLNNMLTHPEKIVQDYVNQLGFQEGAWYRPFHNIIVPAAMIAICKKENVNRDLVYVAQLHDAGNSLMKVTETTQGADWENVDKRWKHMEI